LVCGVISHLVSFGLGKYPQESRIAICYPVPKGKSANKDRNSGKYAVEEIERSDRSNADKVEERPFDAKISEGLMQALEDSICSSLLRLHVCHKPLVVLAATND
jgi:hypothetical protein